MTSRAAHLTDWTLEQLAEGGLSGPDHAQAAAHVDGCPRCAAELDGFRALFVALEGLPRFAPPPDFGDAVMARVRVGPRPHPAVERVRRWLPKTRRGWTLLSLAVVTPALPVVAAVVWLLTHPLVSPGALSQWASLQVQAGGRAAAASVMSWGTATGAVEWGGRIAAEVAATPLTTLGLVLGILAVAIPLSAWSLVRLTRTPTGSVTYAN